MNYPMIRALVRKDLLIYRRSIAIYFGLSILAVGVVSFLVGRLPKLVLFNLGFILLILPTGICGMHVLMNSIVHEKLQSVHPFLMSLPITIRELTWAKILVNVPVFTLLWSVTSAGCLWFAFGLDLFPGGMLPFVTMILVGIYLAYLCILCVSLLFPSLGPSIFSSMLIQVGTAIYLMIIAHTVEPVRLYLYTSTPHWNSTAIGILAGQALLSITVLWGTIFLQSRKRDFV